MALSQIDTCVKNKVNNTYLDLYTIISSRKMDHKPKCKKYKYVTSGRKQNIFATLR